MKKMKKVVLPIMRKIIGICLILLSVMCIGVMAANSKIYNVKIILSNGYEMNVVTTKTKVSEILEENHIILLPEEKVVPSEDSEISDNNTVKISTQEEDTENIEIADNIETSGDITANTILQSYDNIVEKIEVVDEEIPYETITKDISSNSTTTKDVVVQNGKNGLKKVTYKVKYQNDIEIERTKISEEIITEATNKIIEVRKQITVTSRSSTYRTTYNNGKWSYTDSEMDLICAITAQECSSSYEGALAVITCACNRAEMNWGKHGTDPLSQYKAKNQFCYSIDKYWVKRLNGNYSSVVAQAVSDALNGTRNHNYLSFRAKGTATGEVIGGNVFFNAM